MYLQISVKHHCCLCAISQDRVCIHLHQANWHFLISCLCASAWHCQHSRQMIQMFFCIIWSAQLDYPHKFNTLRTVVMRDLLVTMDTAEAKCPELEDVVEIVVVAEAAYHNFRKYKLIPIQKIKVQIRSIHYRHMLPTVAHYTLQPFSWPLQMALISLLQARLHFPVWTDSLGSLNDSSSCPWP